MADDDWDPFADPAAGADPVASDGAAAASIDKSSTGLVSTAVGSTDGFYASEDLFAALRSIGPKSDLKRLSTDEFDALIDELLHLDDSDAAALKDGMQKILVAIAGNNALKELFLRRALPLLVDVVEKNTPNRENLLELVLAYVFGFLVSKEHIIPNDVCVSNPEGEFSGTVIFVLGWGGSYMHQLDDVEEFYRDLLPDSCIVRLVSSAAVNINVKGSAGLRCDIMAALNAALRTWEGKVKPKLLVHLFSNGGMITWTEMLQCWQWLSSKGEPDSLLIGPLPPLASVLQGIILDSAPSCSYEKDVSARDGILGVINSAAPFFYKLLADDHDGSEVQRKQAEAKALKVRSAARVVKDNPIEKFLMTKPERILARGGSVEAKNIHRFEPPVPLQFIYSKTDAVIPYQAVQEYIEEVNKRANRRDVMLPFQLVFEESTHIFHKVLHKEAYWQRVKVFASNVLKG